MWSLGEEAAVVVRRAQVLARRVGVAMRVGAGAMEPQTTNRHNIRTCPLTKLPKKSDSILTDRLPMIAISKAANSSQKLYSKYKYQPNSQGRRKAQIISINRAR